MGGFGGDSAAMATAAAASATSTNPAATPILLTT